MLFYFGGIVEYDVHLISHADDHITLHSPEQERDTCHQSIYHPEQNKGCEHDSHLSEFKTCHLCDSASNSVHLLSFTRFDLKTSTVGEFTEHHHSTEVDNIFLHLPSRAPPVA